MARENISDLSNRLGQQAEAVCRRYLAAGHRQGNYWQVGDARNTPGRSMYVRLKTTDRGAAGKWTDAATGEHGDLLDVIRESCGLIDFTAVLEEARTFLSLPPSEPKPDDLHRRTPVSTGSREAARHLVRMSGPIMGTIVEAYFRNRGITDLRGTGNLHFHPHCYYRPDETRPTETWPAMIAAVTDLHDRITGAHRTWLDPEGFSDTRLGKAPIETQRKAMGELLGHAVRFGAAGDVMAAGEGIESVLSVRQCIPGMPMMAGLSAAHLAAILFPDYLRRLYIVRDNDPAGDGARDSLMSRAKHAGIDTFVLTPTLEDFNEDLRCLGKDRLGETIAHQLNMGDRSRFFA